MDETHAYAVLNASSTSLADQREVLLCVTVALGIDVVLDALDIDIDVPIPLIFDVDASVRLTLNGVQVAVFIWGEAFDRRYHTRIRAMLGEQWQELYTSLGSSEMSVPERFDAVASTLSHAAGVSLPATTLRTVLGAAWPDPLRDVFEGMVQQN
jgi:hypothetical protein